MSPISFQLLLLSISFGAGIFGAVLGLGGGVIIVPALTLGLGVNFHYAVGASIVSVIATSSGAAATYVREKITNIRVAMLLEVATTVGALLGATLATYVDSQKLFFVFSVSLFFSAYLMFRKRHRETSHLPSSEGHWMARALKLNGRFHDPVLRQEVEYVVNRVPLGFFLMLGAGIISGLLGIGSGVLKVPAMDSAMNLPLKVSSATSNFMIGVTAAASAGSYYVRGDIVPLLAAPVALGVLLGSWFGTHVMMKLQVKVLRKIFIVVLFLIALEMLLKSFGISVR